METKTDILIVDDDNIFRAVTRKQLELSNYDVTEACTAIDAMQCIDRRRPCVIILDWNLGQSDGLELCQHLKSNHVTKDIYVLMVSAVAISSQELDAFFAAGADNFMTKPMTPQELLIAVRAGINYTAVHQASDHKVTAVASFHEDFVSNLSYQIIAPVTNLKMNFELMGLNENKRTHYETIIHKNIGELEQIISSIRELLSIENINPCHNRWHLVDLNEILEMAITEFNHTYKKNVAIELVSYLPKEPIWVLTIENQLTHAIERILEKMVETNQSGTVAMGTFGLDCGEAAIYFIDHSIGMSQNEVAAQFNTLPVGQQVYFEEARGVGLTLMLARKVVEIHYGKLIVKSDSMGGKSIYLSFPIVHLNRRIDENAAHTPSKEDF